MVETNYPLISCTLTISLCVYIICQYQSWKKSPKLSKSNIRQATWYQVPYTFWPSRYCFRWGKAYADFIGKQFSFYFPSFQVLERYFLQVCHIWDKLFKSGLNTFFKDCLPQNLLSGKILHTTHIKQYTYSFSLKALFKKLNVWVFFCNPGRMQHESEDAHQF